MSGRFHTLTEWLQTIPEAMRNEQPWLEYWLAVSRLPFDPAEARNHFELAYRRFEPLADPAGLYLSWAGIAEAFNLMWDDFTDMLPWLEKYGGLRKRYPDFPSDSIAANVQAALFGVLIFLQPQHPESAIAREAAEKLLRNAPEPDFRIKVVTNLALFYSWSGAFVDMRRIVEAGEAIIANEPVSPLSRIMVKVSRGTLCWIIGDPAGAHEAIREALAIAEQSGVHMLDSYLLAQSVYASGIRNNPVEMAETLDVIKKHLSPARRIDIAHYYFQMSWYETLRENFSAALEFMRHTMSLLVNLSAQMPLALGRLGMAKALVHAGEYAEADIHLDLALEFARALPSRHFEFIGRMIRAYSWLLQHQEEKCAAELERALGIASKEYDYWTFPLWDPKLVSPLCAVALQRGIETDYVQALIRKWHLLPESSTDTPEAWPWSIRIQTLGGLSIEKDGNTLPLGGKLPKRPLQLLKLLITENGHIAAGRAAELLWPELDGDNAVNNLKATANRLRKLLGAEAVFQKDGAIRLNRQSCWVDSWTFSDIIGQANSSEKLSNDCIGKTLELYRGDFLPEDDDLPWVLPARAKLRHDFLSLAQKHHQFLLERGSPDAADKLHRQLQERMPEFEFPLQSIRSH